MSRNATTVGVDSTGYAEPSGVVSTFGSADGGMDSAIMQKGQGILKVEALLKVIPGRVLIYGTSNKESRRRWVREAADS